MNQRSLFTTALVGIIGALAFLAASNAQAADFYAGLRLGSADLNTSGEQFINPGRTGFAPGDGRISGNSDQSGGSWSALLGRQLQSRPMRLELEYGDFGTETFTSYWQPFGDFAQEVSIDSSYLMVNALYDFRLKSFTVFAGAGVGFARNKADAIQADERVNPQMPLGRRPFAEDTNTNFAYALIVGASKAVSNNIDIELSYKYLDLGDANTGRNEFLGGRGRQVGDEQFKGDLSATQIALGVRYRF